MLRFAYRPCRSIVVKRNIAARHDSTTASNNADTWSLGTSELCKSLLCGPGPIELLDGVVRQVAAQLGRPKAPSVAPSQQAGLVADYQCNVLPLLPSKDALPSVSSSLASSLRSSLSGTLCDANPGHKGFLNIQLLDSYVWGQVQACVRGTDPSAAPPRRGRALIDCGSPNMGKELHPGHCRSGVVGDTLARVLRARGWQVDMVSHVGDAGLPVAIVIWQLQEDGILRDRAALSSFWSGATGGTHRQEQALSPHGLSSAYTRGKAAMKDVHAAAAVQATLRTLQSMLGKVSAAAHTRGATPMMAGQGYRQGATAVLEDPALLQYVRGLTKDEEALYFAWRVVCAASRRGYSPLFSLLQVGSMEVGGCLPEVGEAAYSHMLGPLVQELLDTGAAQVNEGAVAMFVDGREKPPLLARKGDGGYLYATTDLAALRARLQAGYDKVVYVTDSGQGAHFMQVFAGSRMAGWTVQGGEQGGDATVFTNRLAPGPVQLHHAGFGVVTGPGGKKLSSRAGGELTLAGLLEDGQARMRSLRAALAAERAGLSAGEGWAGARLSEAQEEELALYLSSSCIRFSDLLHQRHMPYAYDPDRVLDVRGKGDSATYILYARIRLNTLRRSVAAAMHQAGMIAKQDDGWAVLLSCAAHRAPPLPAGLPHFSPHSPQERALAMALVALPDALASVERTLSPHFAAHSALALASAAHSFYTTCRLLPPSTSPPALSPDQWATLARRLTLAAAAEQAISACCRLLGLYVLDEM